MCVCVRAHLRLSVCARVCVEGRVCGRYLSLSARDGRGLFHGPLRCAHGSLLWRWTVCRHGFARFRFVLSGILLLHRCHCRRCSPLCGHACPVIPLFSFSPRARFASGVSRVNGQRTSAHEATRDRAFTVQPCQRRLQALRCASRVWLPCFTVHLLPVCVAYTERPGTRKGLIKFRANLRVPLPPADKIIVNPVLRHRRPGACHNTFLSGASPAPVSQ